VYDGDATTPVCTTAETSCTITDLGLGSTHTYTVTGVNQLGEGSPSAASKPVTMPEVASNDRATSAPGKAVLSSNDGWDTGLKDGTFVHVHRRARELEGNHGHPVAHGGGDGCLAGHTALSAGSQGADGSFATLRQGSLIVADERRTRPGTHPARFSVSSGD
jgi:hypothetical protein